MMGDGWHEPFWFVSAPRADRQDTHRHFDPPRPARADKRTKCPTLSCLSSGEAAVANAAPGVRRDHQSVSECLVCPVGGEAIGGNRAGQRRSLAAHQGFDGAQTGALTGGTADREQLDRDRGAEVHALLGTAIRRSPERSSTPATSS